jgi:hypothetical protein
MNTPVAPLVAVSLAVLLSGCASASTAPDGLPQSVAAFRVTGADVIPESLTVSAYVLTVVPRGYTLVDPRTGTGRDFDVTPVLLTPAAAGGPQLMIGLLGAPVVGSYSYADGVATRQFHAYYTVPLSPMRQRRFALTHGTLTISRVTSRGVQGRFDLEARHYFDEDRPPIVGSTVTGVPTSFRITGGFHAPHTGPVQ